MICRECSQIRFEGNPNGATIEEQIRLNQMVNSPYHSRSTYEFILRDLRNHGGHDTCIKYVEDFLERM